MKILKIIYITLFLICSLAVLACDVKTEQTNDTNIQFEYHKLINKYYPGYRIINIEELDKMARTFFKVRHPDSNPSLVSDDFDGNGLPDFAFLLTNKKRDNTVLVILLQQSLNNFHHSFFLSMDSYRSDIVITPIKKNTLLSQAEAISSEEEKVLLQNPSIQLIYIGKSAVVYYWDKNKNTFSEIWTSD
jgi:hypothetical protein